MDARNGDEPVPWPIETMVLGRHHEHLWKMWRNDCVQTIQHFFFYQLFNQVWSHLKPTFHDNPKAAAAVEPLDANAPLAFERACAELITAGSPGATQSHPGDGDGFDVVNYLSTLSIFFLDLLSKYIHIYVPYIYIYTQIYT